MKKCRDELDHSVDFEIEKIDDMSQRAERYPPFLTLRGDFQKLKEITGNGTWADGNPILVGVGDTGLDFDHMKGDLKGAERYNFTTDPNAGDGSGHGSHVACHIGAKSNEDGIEGIASDCKIIAAKVLNNQGSGATSWIQRGVSFLGKDKKCKIINLSLGGGGFDRTSDALYKELDDAGVLVFAAAGNSGQGGERGGYPARYNSTVSITAIDYNKRLASFSSETSSANLAGYGVSIDSCWTRGRYSSISGTSMATPDQVGMCALLLGYFDRLGITVKNKAHYLELVAPGIQDLGQAGRDRFYGEGFIDPWKVIEFHGLPSEQPVEPEPTPVDPEPTPEPTEPCPDCPPCKPQPEVLVELGGYGIIKLED